MEYNDEELPTLENFAQMAKAYNFSLKQKGFVFINLEAEGKTLLINEVFDILFKLRSSYRHLGSFLDSTIMLSLTEKHIDLLRDFFDVEENRGFFVTTNQTKCFLNTISLENTLSIKLLLLSQKCDFNEEILSMIIERAKSISQNLAIENALGSKKF